MSLVERDGQLDLLERSLGESAAGKGRVALVTGPVGSGRTTLLGQLAERANRRSFRVLRATGARDEQHLAGNVLAQVLQDVGLAAAARALSDEFAVASAGGSAGVTTGSGIDPAAAELLNGVVAALVRLSDSAPVALVVDDVQFVDPDSLCYLLYLARRIGSARIAVVFSEAVTSSGSAAHAHLAHEPHYLEVRLAPLSRAGVARLLAEFGPDEIPPHGHGGIDVEVAALSGGNPLLVRAVLDDLAHASSRAGSLLGATAGPALRRAMVRWLHRCDPPTASTAQALAVLGTPATAAELAGLTGVRQELVRRCVENLTEAGLLRAGTFHHPSIRAATLAAIPGGARGRIEADAARLRHQQGADAWIVARHLLAAGGGPAEDWVEPCLREAGRHAADVDDAELAVDLGELAARQADEPARGYATRAWLARIECRTNPAAAARHLPGLLAPSGWRHLIRRDQAAVIRHLLWLGRTDDAVVLLRRPASAAAAAAVTRAATGTPRHGTASGDVASRRTAARPPAPRPRRARLWLVPSSPEGDTAAPDVTAVGRAVPRTGKDGQPAAGDEDTDDSRCLELALACSYPALAPPDAASDAAAGVPPRGSVSPLGQAVGALADVLRQHRPDDAASRAERLLRGVPLRPHPAWPIEPTMFALLTLVYADHSGSAARWCDALLVDAEQRRATTARALLTATRAEIALRRGDLPHAVEFASSALALLPARAWGVGIGLPLGTLVLALTRTGAIDEAAAQLDLVVPDAMFDSRYGLHYRYARGHHALAQRRPEAALTDFLACEDQARAWQMDVPGLVPWRLGVAEALLAQGHHDEARAAATHQVAQVAAAHPAVRGAALRLLAAATPDPRHRVTLLVDAVDALETSDRFQLTHALSDLSTAHAALGDHARGGMVRRRAWHVARSCSSALPGAEPATAGSTGAGSRAAAAATGSLTRAERRVAELAALGYTNRQIAGKLFVTPSTVEQHLTRVYRKLNVQYRVELPSALHPDISETA